MYLGRYCTYNVHGTLYFCSISISAAIAKVLIASNGSMKLPLSIMVITPQQTTHLLRHATRHRCAGDSCPDPASLVQELADPSRHICRHTHGHCTCLPPVESSIRPALRLLLGRNTSHSRMVPLGKGYAPELRGKMADEIK